MKLKPLLTVVGVACTIILMPTPGLSQEFCSDCFEVDVFGSYSHLLQYAPVAEWRCSGGCHWLTSFGGKCGSHSYEWRGDDICYAEWDASATLEQLKDANMMGERQVLTALMEEKKGQIRFEPKTREFAVLGCYGSIVGRVTASDRFDSEWLASFATSKGTPTPGVE